MTAGVTSDPHVAGLLARQRGSHALTEPANYGVERYATLEAQTRIPTGFNRCGSLTVARTPERVDELRAMHQCASHESALAGTGARTYTDRSGAVASWMPTARDHPGCGHPV